MTTPILNTANTAIAELRECFDKFKRRRKPHTKGDLDLLEEGLVAAAVLYERLRAALQWKANAPELRKPHAALLEMQFELREWRDKLDAEPAQ